MIIFNIFFFNRKIVKDNKSIYIGEKKHIKKYNSIFLVVLFFFVSLSGQVMSECISIIIINNNKNNNIENIFLFSYIFCYLLNFILISLERRFFKIKITTLTFFCFFILYFYIVFCIVLYPFNKFNMVYLFFSSILSSYIVNNLIRYNIQVKYTIDTQKFLFSLYSTSMTLSLSVSLYFPLFISKYFDISLMCVSLFISVLSLFIFLFLFKRLFYSKLIK
ncbi:hypothetical protein JGUZn3_15890 [Entomobacter blattae]|uniref:Uncharacterized protein n=1 Tax=Entomobacter blattae TaxID=2762277 RepID=A0A7H1NSQ2_9PROT|nr:hypothetical protein JGUZn3_15890 [Entomobacter blattae]